MNRQQLSLIVVLGLISSTPAFAAGNSEQEGGWRTSSEEAAASTLSGKLYRNSADSTGSAPYILLDRWGVVRGYVAAAPGLELETCVGQQVSLQGKIRTLPGGDMPYLTCQRVLSGSAGSADSQIQQMPVSPRRSDMAADAAPRNVALPLREVVLEPQSSAADDSQEFGRPQLAPRADSRQPRRQAAQATNFQETLPAPAPGRPVPVMPAPVMPGPAGEMHRSPLAADPELEPSPEEGPMISADPLVGHRHGRCDSCAQGACDGGCGVPCDTVCGDDACWGPRRPLFCWGPSGIWLKADYLQWWEKGMHVPPLVTTGPDATNPGYIGTPGTTVLFGGDSINDKSESGGRIQAGLWLNSCLTFGLEGEYFALDEQNTNYSLWSDGNPIISRPFFDTSINEENVELVAFPRGSARSLDGTIDITATTRFHGAGAHFVFTLCRQEGFWTDDCSCKNYTDRFRAILTAGYRYLDLEDSLSITETLTATSPQPVDPTNPTGAQGVSAFLIHDQFNTQNTFSGGDLGMKFEFQRNRWSLDVFPRIALGSTHEVVDINGSTRTTSPSTTGTGVETTSVGGLLALSSNIGHYEQDSFAVVPEIDLKLGYQVTPHTRVVFGYDCIYWSKVARAGEQIDQNVNGTQLPIAAANGVPQTGPTAPLFGFQETSFWVQGFNVGLDCRW